MNQLPPSPAASLTEASVAASHPAHVLPSTPRRTVPGHDLLESLLAMACRMREARHAGSALGAVTRVAQELTKSTQVTVRLLDSKESRLLVAARQGRAMHIGGAGRFRADEGLIGWVVTHDQSLLVPDVARDQRFSVKEGQTWMPRSLLAVPLRGSRSVIGVISAARADGEAYTAHDLRVLKLIAELATPHLQVEFWRVRAERDPLTGLYNQRKLQQLFGSVRSAAERDGAPLSAIMLDLDHFGKINKAHGHEVGNRVLTAFARCLEGVCRDSDTCFRWGGEEFFVLLPGTSQAEARKVAARILAATRALSLSSRKGPVTLTASLGVLAVHAGATLAEVEELVDDLMRTAKREGRDQVRHDATPSYDFGNFFRATTADWLPREAAPARDPDFVSPSGSAYWDAQDGVYRRADHWGPEISDCAWFLAGHETWEQAVAYCPYSLFEPHAVA